MVSVYLFLLHQHFVTSSLCVCGAVCSLYYTHLSSFSVWGNEFKCFTYTTEWQDHMLLLDWQIGQQLAVHHPCSFLALSLIQTSSLFMSPKFDLSICCYVEMAPHCNVGLSIDHLKIWKMKKNTF